MMQTSIMYIGIILFITLLFTIVIGYYRKSKKSSLPTNWPILGMLPALVVNFGQIHHFVTNMLQHSGGTILFKGPWFTNMEMLITCDPANIHYILTKNFPNFPKGPDFKKMFDVLGDGIFIAEDESWENQRRTSKSLINLTTFHDFVAATSWDKVDACLLPILDLSSEMGTDVDLQELFKRFAFDAACIEVLGHDPGSLCHELPDIPYEKAFVDAEEAVLYRHILPEFLWKLQSRVGMGKERKLRQGKEVVDGFLSRCISEKRERFKTTMTRGEQDMLACYMRASSTTTHDVSEETWRDTMLNLIFAGKDTISAALTWFFWLLAKNPGEEDKIREEMVRNLEVDESGRWKYDGKKTEELKKLVYLQAALCEALRLFPPVPFQHKAPVEKDTLPSGHRINANTRTVISFYSTGRMEWVWGSDCLEFRPGRWISEVGRIKVEPSFKFVAFNAGPRSCLGKEISFIQMKIVAAAIITRFTLKLLHHHPINPSASVILHMTHGLKVNVSKL